jgi:hypothetical protein
METMKAVVNTRSARSSSSIPIINQPNKPSAYIMELARGSSLPTKMSEHIRKAVPTHLITDLFIYLFSTILSSFYPFFPLLSIKKVAVSPVQRVLRGFVGYTPRKDHFPLYGAVWPVKWK